MRTISYSICSFAVIAFLFCGDAMAQQPATPDTEATDYRPEPYTLMVRVLNKKGKPFKAAPVVVNVVGATEFYDVPKSTGQVSIPGVTGDDVLNLFAGSVLYNIEVGGLDSLDIVFNNPNKLRGVYNQDQMINTGYGLVDPRSNTEAYATLRARNTEHYSSLFDYLQGRVAGLEISGNTVRIRGSSSINSSNEPLFVVDGVVMDAASANSLVVPRDIESITVDKTGSMYGVRGANGAVIITTITGPRRN